MTEPDHQRMSDYWATSPWESHERLGVEDHLRFTQRELESISGGLELLDQRASESIRLQQDLLEEAKRLSGSLSGVVVLLVAILGTLWWKL